MRWKLTLFAALVFGALAGSWIKNLPGFVIIAIDKTSYEMRLWVAVTLILLLFGLFAGIGILLRGLGGGVVRLKGWRDKRQWQKARQRTIRGMLAFTEGHWKQAEEAMIKAAEESETPLFNYLIAAQAAQNQQAEVRRDAWLKAAHEAEPSAKVAIGITQAQLLLQNQQYEQALATLSDLRSQFPGHSYVLKLLLKTYRQLKDWHNLMQLLPAARKLKVHDEATLHQLEHEAVSGLLEACAKAADAEKLKDVWQKLPASARKQIANQRVYARYLVAFDQHEEAHKLLRQILKKTEDEEAIRLFAEVESKDLQSQFNFLEDWHQTHVYAPNVIFLALGKLALKLKLWGKAGQYLQQAIDNQPSAEAFLLMADSLTERGEQALARDYHRQGLAWLSEKEKARIGVRQQALSEDFIKAELLPTEAAASGR